NIHYFEYQFGRVRTGIGSSVVLAREMNEFHLTDFFPVASWHNANIVPNNHSLFADASIVPVPGLEVYAAVGLDDVNGEAVGVSDSDVPTIPAVTVGVTGEYRPGRGETAIRYVAESGSTHYLWGSFNDGLELSRGIYRMDLFGENRWMPLTSRYGPGTTWGILEADIHHPITDSLTITAGVSFELWERIDGIGLTETPYAAIPDIDSRDRKPRARIEFPISASFGDRAALRLTPVLTGPGGNLQPELRGTATVTFRGRYTEKVD
ncbi:MAG: hypothetical protein ACOCU4_05865, partial [Alkalispirochaeta sp.]